jgi:hypothetical protein
MHHSLTWLKWLYTSLVAVLAPAFALEYGVINFLWFSNVVLFGTLAALWLQSRLLASMMALAGILPEFGWTVLFLGAWLFDLDLFGLVAYMFDARIPLWARLLSLYHIPLPFLLVWLIWRWGYDARALKWQTLLAVSILLASFLFSSPWQNINLVYGLVDGAGQPLIAPPIPLLVIAVGLPLAVYFPTHLVLRRYFGRDEAYRATGA